MASRATHSTNGHPDQVHTDTEAHTGQSVAPVVTRNIQSLVTARRESDHRRTIQDHIADAVTAFSGNMTFVYLHVVWFGSWIGWNIGLSGLEPFDPYPFGMLTTIVSLEAIFLSTFVLISQNRQAKIADRRADLDLQINLLAEHEITRVLRLLDAMARRLDVSLDGLPPEPELKRDVHPDEMLRQLEMAETDEHRR